MAGKLQTWQPEAGGDRLKATDQTSSGPICTAGRCPLAALRSGGPGREADGWPGPGRAELVRCAEGKKMGKRARWEYWRGSISRDWPLEGMEGLGWKRGAENLAEGVNPEGSDWGRGCGGTGRCDQRVKGLSLMRRKDRDDAKGQSTAMGGRPKGETQLYKVSMVGGWPQWTLTRQGMKAAVGEKTRWEPGKLGGGRDAEGPT